MKNALFLFLLLTQSAFASRDIEMDRLVDNRTKQVLAVSNEVRTLLGATGNIQAQINAITAVTGVGVSSINGLSTPVQLFAMDTAGLDFAIASFGTTHTFSLPTASASARGALSSADWSAFFAKQNALGYVPLNRAGDTMSGPLQVPSLNGLSASTLAFLSGATAEIQAQLVALQGATATHAIQISALQSATAAIQNEAQILQGATTSLQAQINALVLSTHRTASTLTGATVLPVFTHDLLLNADSSSGAFQVTLADALASAGFCASIKNTGNPLNGVTVSPPPGQLLEGVSTGFVLSTPNKTERFCPNGGNWFIY